MGLRSRIQPGLPKTSQLEMLWLDRQPHDELYQYGLAIGFNFPGVDGPLLMKNRAFEELTLDMAATKPEDAGYSKQRDRPVFHQTAVLTESGEYFLPDELLDVRLPEQELDESLQRGIPLERLQPDWSSPDTPDDDEMVCPYCDAVNSEAAMYCVECREVIDPRVA